jgi:four helix bundle protein
MIFSRFEDILSWKRGKELTLLIYEYFRNNKDYSFKDQIQRASISIMNNISEGFERGSNKDFIKFLYYAKGSCGEVRPMLYIAKNLEYINEKQFQGLFNLSENISKLIQGLIKKLQ